MWVEMCRGSVRVDVVSDPCLSHPMSRPSEVYPSVHCLWDSPITRRGPEDIGRTRTFGDVSSGSDTKSVLERGVGEEVVVRWREDVQE